MDRKADGGGQDGGSSGPLGQWSVLLRQIAENPASALLAVGLLLVLVAVVKQAGGFRFENRGSQYLALAIGVALILSSFIWPWVAHRSRQTKLVTAAGRDLPPEALDTEFLLKVFLKAMPPAFVKKFHSEKPGAHLVQSDALIRSQQSPDSKEMPTGDRYWRIKDDHLAGDLLAMENGYSIQLELPDSYVRGRLQPILTFKTLFEHKGERYIAGWYVPIERQSVPKGASQLRLREEAHQILFRLSLSKEGSGVNVGQAIAEAIADTPPIVK